MLVPRFCGFCGSRFLTDRPHHNADLPTWCPTCTASPDAVLPAPPSDSPEPKPAKPSRKHKPKRKD